MPSPLVIVFGSSRTRERRHLEAAQRLGRLLAEAGYAVGSGGYAAVMDAVSQGAYEAGGQVVAYTTDEFPDAVATRWHHDERRTPDLNQRLQRMLQEGDAFIATWGGIGTLTEVAYTWNIAQVAAYQHHSFKPLLLMGEHWPPLIDCIGRQTEIGSSVLAYPTLVATPEETVAQLQRMEIGKHA